MERLEDRTLLAYDFGYALGLSSPGVDIGFAVAADSAGNVTVTGTFSSGSIDLDTGPGSYVLENAGATDAFAASYTPEGTLRWAVHFSSTVGNGAGDAAIDGNGNVFVTGSVGGTLQIIASGGAPITLSATGNESFLAKFDPGGNLLWARTLGEAGANHFAYGLATDAAGNVYATGDLSDGTQRLHQAFIAKYDGASGTTVWSRLIKDGTGIYLPYSGSTTYASGYGGIAVDASGNVCILGTYLGTVDFDPDPTQTYWLTYAGNGFNEGNGDVFVLKLNAAGNFVWAGSLGSVGFDSADAIAVDGAGNIYVDGYYSADTQNDLDPGPSTLQLSGSGNFVVKIEPSGDLLWALGNLEGGTVLPGKGMKIDAAGNVYTTRNFSGTIDADPGPGTFTLTSAGSGDILVSKLDSAGNFVWAAAMGGPGTDQGRAIAVDGQGNIFTTGLFQQTADFDPSSGTHYLTSTLDANGNPTSDVFVSKLTANDSPPPLPAPSLAINDATVIEGNAGTIGAAFTVSLSAVSTETVLVSFATASGTALAGSDYVAASGTLSFAPGETSKTITIPVTGDALHEATETFFVSLSNPAGAVIADGQGVGTILNDDPVPSLTINDVSLVEGQSGTTSFVFTVRLSAASGKSVTVDYATANGTAKVSDNDYVAKSGTLTFAPGETAKTITIAIKGDKKKENNEFFYLNLFNAHDAIFADAQGLGTILNDDNR